MPVQHKHLLIQSKLLPALEQMKKRASETARHLTTAVHLTDYLDCLSAINMCVPCVYVQHSLIDLRAVQTNLGKSHLPTQHTLDTNAAQGFSSRFVAI